MESESTYEFEGEEAVNRAKSSLDLETGVNGTIRSIEMTVVSESEKATDGGVEAQSQNRPIVNAPSLADTIEEDEEREYSSISYGTNPYEALGALFSAYSECGEEPLSAVEVEENSDTKLSSEELSTELGQLYRRKLVERDSRSAQTTDKSWEYEYEPSMLSAIEFSEVSPEE